MPEAKPQLGVELDPDDDFSVVKRAHSGARPHTPFGLPATEPFKVDPASFPFQQALIAMNEYLENSKPIKKEPGPPAPPLSDDEQQKIVAKTYLDTLKVLAIDPGADHYEIKDARREHRLGRPIARQTPYALKSLLAYTRRLFPEEFRADEPVSQEYTPPEPQTDRFTLRPPVYPQLKDELQEKLASINDL